MWLGRKWWQCDRMPHVYRSFIVTKVIVRCDCGWHIRPRLVWLEEA